MNEVENEVEQEIEWLREEIEQDEHLINSSDFSSFHQQRIDENKEKYFELTGEYYE